MFTHDSDHEKQAVSTPLIGSDVPARTPVRPAHTVVPVQRKQNRLPDKLRHGIEALSGVAMDDVEVHYNSPQPAALQALAYTQGNRIFIAPGQETHLPHEAWHVVQQKLGRVQPTTRVNAVPVNDHPQLEREADEMGRQAARFQLPDRLAAPRRGAANLSTVAMGNGRYKIEASSSSQLSGSVIVQDKDAAAVQLTNLGVETAFRRQGLGQQLIQEAAHTAQKLGKTQMHLAAQDNGSGRLAAWYKKLGFTQVGIHARGYPLMTARVNRLQANPVQRMMGLEETQTSDTIWEPKVFKYKTHVAWKLRRSIKAVDDALEIYHSLLKEKALKPQLIEALNALRVQIDHYVQEAEGRNDEGKKQRLPGVKLLRDQVVARLGVLNPPTALSASVLPASGTAVSTTQTPFSPPRSQPVAIASSKRPMRRRGSEESEEQVTEKFFVTPARRKLPAEISKHLHVYIHMTKPAYKEGIEASGLVAGKQQGIGKYKGMEGDDVLRGSPDTSNLYVLSGSNIKTSKFVNMEAGAQPVVVVSWYGAPDRDANYPEGGAYRFGRHIEPITAVTSANQSQSSTFSFTLPITTTSKTALAAFLNQRLHTPCQPDEAIEMVETAILQIRGFSFLALLSSQMELTRKLK